MIFSRETLARIGPHIRRCLRENIFSTHEDVEVGRCVRKYAGIDCTWNYEMSKIFFHNGTYADSFAEDLNPAAFDKAVAFHPVKKPNLQFRLLHHAIAQRIQRLRHKVVQLRKTAADLANGERALNKTSGVFHRFTGDGYFVRAEWTPPQRSYGNDWTFFDRWSLSSARNLNPRVHPSGRFQRAVDDAIDQLLLRLNADAHLRGCAVDLKQLDHGYAKLVPFSGVDYVVKLSLNHRQLWPKKKTFVKKWIGRLRIPFSEIQSKEIPLAPSKINDETSRLARAAPDDQSGLVASVKNYLLLPQSPKIPALEPINFVLTLAGRLGNYKRFLGYWESACFPSESCTLTVVLFSTGNSSLDRKNETEEFFEALSRRHPSTTMRLLHAKGAFSRGIGIELGASYYPLNALLFICDVDLVFTSALLDRIRRNTESSKLVYYPIMYSQYNATLTFPENRVTMEEYHGKRKGDKPFFDVKQLPFRSGWNESVNCFNDAHLGEMTGYWRQFSFGMLAIYNTDLRRSGGYDLQIRGWGKEDTDLAEKILCAGLDVFRGADVGLYHVYHQIRCDRSLPPDQLHQCLNTQLQTWLSTTVVGKKVLPIKDSFQFRPDVNFDIVP